MLWGRVSPVSSFMLKTSLYETARMLIFGSVNKKILVKKLFNDEEGEEEKK